MATMFSKPKAPDTSKQQALLAEQEKRITQQENETKKRQAAALRARQAGKRNPLITGGEVGVLKDTLG